MKPLLSHEEVWIKHGFASDPNFSAKWKAEQKAKEKNRKEEEAARNFARRIGQ
jgi:hypothetical protein